MKKLISVVLILSVVFFAAFAGGDSEKGAATAEAKTSTVSHIPTGAAPAEKVVITFWDSYSGDNHQCLVDCAAAFNASQDQFQVDVVYTSSILTKVLTSTKDDRPNLFNVSGNDSAQVISSRTWDDPIYIPAQEYIDYDNYDMSDIIANLATNYTREGNWQSLPWGNTATGYFYNLEILSAHGINVDDIKNYEDLYQVCKKLKAEGVENPIWIYIHQDWVNFGLTSEGLNYFNEDNGRAAVPTKALFDDPEVKEAVVAYFNWIKKMQAEGLCVDYNVSASDARNMFGQGDVAIYFGWASGYNPTYTVVSQGANFKFAYRPSLTFRNVPNKGQAAGGQSLFIGNTGNEWEEYGTWQFLKFMMSNEWDAAFAYTSGYLPIKKASFNIDIYKDYVNEKNPSAPVVAAAQEATAPGLGYALLPYSSNYGTIVKAIIKNLFADPAYTAEQAVADLQKQATEAIEDYWLQQGVVL